MNSKKLASGKSIRHRFIYALVAVVTGILVVFSVAIILFNVNTIDKELEKRLEDASKLAGLSLSSALWQFNYGYVDDFIESIFLDEDIVFAKVMVGKEIVDKKYRPGFPNKDFAWFRESPDFIVKEVNITYEENQVGRMQLAVTRQRIQETIVTNSIISIILLAAIVAALSLTIFFITRRYVFRPLIRLEGAAAQISKGDLDTTIDTSASDEIGKLAKAFDLMIRNLKAITASRDELNDEIKERRRAEKAVIGEKLFSDAIIENVPAGIAFLDRDFRLRKYNQAYAKMIEAYSPFTPEESLGMSYYDYNPGSRDQVGELFTKVRDTSRVETLIGFKLVLQLEEKEAVTYWDAGIAPVKSPDGTVNGILILTQDVTERKHLESQLQQSQKMEAIATLTGGIAHDYNNLMSIIMGNLSMAMDEAEPDSILADFLDQANTASHKVRDLTHELMSFSRGGSPVKELGSLDELLKSASDVILADSGISLNESISQDLMQVPYDRYKMGAVIRNVVNNAVEAMPDVGIIKIMAENLRIDGETQDPSVPLKPGDYVRISIQDQGKGIPEKHLGQIYDPYFSTKAKGVQKGMGLGLATAYAIVQKHGGHIAIDSALGVGTTVNIYLPTETQPEEIESKITSDNDKALPVKRVLVMDDEEMLRNLAQKMLERMGYAMETVKDGVEAIDAFKKQKDSGEPFDAVILDLTIKGGMGGEHSLRELLKIDPHIKAIVCSGYFNDPVMSDFQKYGFKGAITKPYDKKNLKEALEKLFS